MAELRKFGQGTILKSGDPDFYEGLRASIDYRGDVTIRLQDGSQVIGYVFNGDAEGLELFPIHGSQKECVSFKKIEAIEFSGEDAAHGKSWEDWVKKKRSQEVGAHPA